MIGTAAPDDGMNDSELRKVSDGTGYLLPFMLSALVHVLLGCAFWLAPEVNHVSGANDTAAKNTALPGALQAVQAPNVSRVQSSAFSQGASTNANLLRTGATESGGGKQGNHSPKAAKATPNSALRANTHRSPSSKADRSSRSKARENTLLSARMTRHPSGQRKGSAVLKNKSDAVAAKPGIKNMRVRHANKETPRRNEAKIRHAEAKRLERMREAELRRINQHIS